MRRTNARWHWTARHAEVALLAAGLAVAVPIAAGAAAADPAGRVTVPADLYLEVTLNGVRHPQPLHFLQAGATLLADRATLHALGLPCPATRTPRPARSTPCPGRCGSTTPRARRWR